MPTALRREAIIRAALEDELLDEAMPLVGMVDRDELHARVRELQEAFEGRSPMQHMVATKAATLVPLLAELIDRGIGCEVASPGELAMARAAGAPVDRMIFDSPAKTTADLRDCLDRGIPLNIDGFQELERVDALIAEGRIPTRAGFRINPQRGAGSIDAMSTATPTSKFGVGIRDEGARERLIQAYVDRPWMRHLHVHSGSQGVSLAQMALGIRDMVEIADEIDRRCGQARITHLDIGGGLPVNFDGDETAPTFREYREVLEQTVPGLLDGRRMIITEFGRALLAKAGFILTRVEYTKQTGGRRIAIAHAGAQIATRTVFVPEAWPVRVAVHGRNGSVKQGPRVEQDVAGPCCFAGDMLARGRELPVIEQGDLLAALDTGAYYFSTHYAYNALPRCAVYFAEGDDDSIRFSPIRRAETLEEQLAAAGADLR